jgi:carbon-monoxide dehydrogenase large subunit
VKWIEDRRENLIAANHARLGRARVKMAFDADGHVLAVAADHLDDTGAYPLGAVSATSGMVFMMLPGPYRIPRVGFTTTTVYTNTCGRGAYRGPWQLESVLREVVLDIGARKLGLDALEIRRRNVLRQDELPFATATGLQYDAISPAETLDQAADILRYDEMRAEQAEARAEGRCVGIGIALYVEPTGGVFGPMATEAATLRVEPAGTVSVALSSANHGQSLETTIAQVVADALGVGLDDVVVLEGDTAVAPFGGGTGGSRSAVLYGGAAHAAAVRIKEKVLTIAAHLMEAAPEDLELNDGCVSVRGTPTRTISLADVAAIAYTTPERLPEGTEAGLEAAARFSPTQMLTMANSCHMAMVEIEPETGITSLLRYVTSEDCGVVIHPNVVHGQIAGGVVQGLGGVLLEQCVYDEDGNPLTTTFLDYLLPSAPDVPMIEYGSVVTPARSNPGGYKGAGEGGAIGSVPAIVNAVADALAPLGVTVTDQPLGPNEIFSLLHG